MRKIASRVIVAPLAGSSWPIASCNTTLPWRAISATAPGNRPLATSACKVSKRSALRAGSKPRDASGAVGSGCDAVIHTFLVSMRKVILVNVPSRYERRTLASVSCADGLEYAIARRQRISRQFSPAVLRASSCSCNKRHITLPAPLLGSASKNSTLRGTL